MSRVTDFNDRSIRGLLPGGYSRRRVYFTNEHGVVLGSRAIGYEYNFGNWGGISFRYNGTRFREIPSTPFVQGRVEVPSYKVF